MEITSRNAHIKLKGQGSPEKYRLFCYMAGVLDLDFPYALADQRRHPGEDLRCGTCGGMIYRTPGLSVDNLKDLARQVDETNRVPGHFKLKIKQFTYNPDCKLAVELAEES